MAIIIKKIIKELDLTVFAVVGQVFFEQMKDTMADFYNSDFTKNTLWDFSKADFSNITDRQRVEIISVSKKSGQLRIKKGGRTAIVVADDLSYGLARVHEAYSHIFGYGLQLSIFREFDEALDLFKIRNLEL